MIRKAREETREKTGEKILRLIKNNPMITAMVIAEKLGLTIGGVEWNIDKMKREGLIKRVGPDKGGHWEIINNIIK